jgi:4-diphosphocytidyl-2-C-methyl-D-erythritol kinase
LIAFPNCKINFGLYILDKRPDGFHNLETVFFPVPLKDALEIIPQKKTESTFLFTASGIPVDGAVSNNLCSKAFHLLQKDYPQIPPVQMHLHKAIPLGAGLGGGSADAAFTLTLLNKQFQLGLSTQSLITYALALGSDCPFFILNKPCAATGRGEKLEEIALDLSAYTIILINPRIHVNTGWAFAQLNRQAQDAQNTLAWQNRKSLQLICQQPIHTWKHSLVNDFEAPVMAQYPAIQTVKETLYRQGAIFAAMSGSGSTVFGIFEKGATPAINLPAEYFIANLPL